MTFFGWFISEMAFGISEMAFCISEMAFSISEIGLCHLRDRLYDPPPLTPLDLPPPPSPPDGYIISHKLFANTAF